MTVGEFIEALGGTQKAAALFGVKSTAVSNWRVWNRLPQRLHLRALREAHDRGLPFDPERPSPKRFKGSAENSTELKAES